MKRLFLLLMLLLVVCNVSANERQGIVCLGKNLAKTLSEQSDRLYLKIGDSEKIYFERPYNRPKVVVRNLDRLHDHIVKVFFDDKLVQSWILNFEKLKTDGVLIWRASGSWRMEPYDTALCE